MINQASTFNGNLALDGRSLDALRLQAKQSPQQAIKSVAQQFEAIFLQSLLKSMRDATPQDGMMDSEQTRMYTSMLDQQLSQSLSARGIGLADIMARQLSRNSAATSPFDTAAPGDAQTPGAAATILDVPLPPATLVPTAPAALSAPVAASGNTAVTAPPPDAIVNPAAVQSTSKDTSQSFLQRMKEHAMQASSVTGIPAHFLLGHAALESGWGKHEIRAADGSPSHNLFGIKAGRNWTGATVDVMTTEYVNGSPRKMTQKFRAYGSYAEAFQNYANLMQANPRYAGVMKQSDSASFAQGLQKAGYASDPAYAQKLTQVLNGSRLRRAVVV
jgi:flagellar protein FlgJ